jgi:hypothetical protein
LLVDWLLVDAPLQHLREDDGRWRLRVTVNGDSFLVDRQTPLWLRGWRRGANAVQLELLDGRGEPLNPPFNSLVQEVRLDPKLPRPAWQGGLLTSSDLAILLGQAPPSAPLPPLSEAVGAEPEGGRSNGNGNEDTEEPSAQGTEAALTDAAPDEESLSEEALSEDGVSEENDEFTKTDVQNTSTQKDGGIEEEQTAPVGDGPGEPLPLPQPKTPPEPQPDPEPDPLPLRSAREEVNPDGTLRREPRTGPLAGLRERLGR